MPKYGVVVGVCPASEQQCRALCMCWVGGGGSILGVSSNARLPAGGTSRRRTP